MTRRFSIVGPLLLILVGAGLLAANLRDDLSVATLVAEHWPWLLVAWGGLRILEHLVWWARGGSGPAPADSGAVIAALLVCGAGAAFHEADKRGVSDLLRSGTLRGIFSPGSHSFPLEERRLPIPPGDTLTVSGLHGRLSVRPGEGDALVVSGDVRVQRRGEELARELADEAGVRLDGHRLRFQRLARTTYAATLLAPAERRLEIEDWDGRVDVAEWRGAVAAEGRGRFEAAGVAGPIEVRFQRSGSLYVHGAERGVDVEGPARKVEIEETAGPVRLRGNLLDDVRVSAVEGEVDLVTKRFRVRAAALPGLLRIDDEEIEVSGATGGLEIETKGDARIRVEGVSGDVSVFAQDGRVEVAPPLEGAGSWSVRLEEGDIELRAPEGGRFQIIARGDPARIGFEDFTGEPERLPDDAGLRFGTEGPTIELHTGDGEIRIRVEPPPVEAPIVERL